MTDAETRTLVVTVDLEGYDTRHLTLHHELADLCAEYLKARLPSGGQVTVKSDDVTAILEEFGDG